MLLHGAFFVNWNVVLNQLFSIQQLSAPLEQQEEQKEQQEATPPPPQQTMTTTSNKTQLYFWRGFLLLLSSCCCRGAQTNNKLASSAFWFKNNSLVVTCCSGLRSEVSKAMSRKPPRPQEKKNNSTTMVHFLARNCSFGLEGLKMSRKTPKFRAFWPENSLEITTSRFVMLRKTSAQDPRSNAFCVVGIESFLIKSQTSTTTT